ncbi:MAG: suppressor of fused domain protein [Pirellulaceae bacterium]
MRLNDSDATDPQREDSDHLADLVPQAEAAMDQWYERKTALLVEHLGTEYEMVMHAIIPFALGGGLDLYYFTEGLPGTVIATKELSEVPGEGPRNEVFHSYELAMATRHALDLDQAKDPETPLGQAHANMNAILNLIALYSAEASLNPHETCEFPAEMEDVGGKCLVFDGLTSFDFDQPQDFGILWIIEVFRSEMNFARQEGTPALLERLRLAGHYPYSDMDREPVA